MDTKKEEEEREDACFGFSEFIKGYKRLASASDEDAHVALVEAERETKLYSAYPNVWNLVDKYITGRFLNEVVPDSNNGSDDRRQLFFHLSIPGDSPFRYRKLESDHEGVLRRVLRAVHNSVRKAAPEGHAFRMFWSHRLECWDRWLCMKPNACFSNGVGTAMTVNVRRGQIRCPTCSRLHDMQPWCSKCGKPRSADGVCPGRCGLVDKDELGCGEAQVKRDRGCKLVICIRFLNVVARKTKHEMIGHACAATLNKDIPCWDFQSCLEPTGNKNIKSTPVLCARDAQCVNEHFAPVEPRPAAIPRIRTQRLCTKWLKTGPSRGFSSQMVNSFRLRMQLLHPKLRKRGEWRDFTAEFEKQVRAYVDGAENARCECAWSPGPDSRCFHAFFSCRDIGCPAGGCRGSGRFEVWADGKVWTVSCIEGCDKSTLIDGGGSINASHLCRMLWMDARAKDENDKRQDDAEYYNGLPLGIFNGAFMQHNRKTNARLEDFVSKLRKRRKFK